ncbi:hypothetical protein KS4_28060 [Poriferisphaera corsica]|uniref:Uncharacterized protein n=1 Tax=Poriferisphaera corsica TaxID=2528020 RepID=A0A517YWZ0_9BACT|nr:hypothetical protein KS4_28060 [Poriferisphaera corsica]
MLMLVMTQVVLPGAVVCVGLALLQAIGGVSFQTPRGAGGRGVVGLWGCGVVGLWGLGSGMIPV